MTKYSSPEAKRQLLEKAERLKRAHQMAERKALRAKMVADCLRADWMLAAVEAGRAE